MTITWLKRKNLKRNAVVEEESEKTKTQLKEEKRREREERERQKKNRNKIVNTEKEIEQIETKISELDELLCLEEVYSNPERSKEVSQEKSNLEDRLAELYELWEELM